MAKMTEKQLAKWEKKRNIGQEIVQGIRDLKAGRAGRRFAQKREVAAPAAYPKTHARKLKAR